MKISINSTFSYIKFNLNYGSALQCYALQQYLKNRGHSVSHLRDYRANPKYILRRFKNLKYTGAFFKKARAQIKLQKFIREHIELSKRAYFSYRGLIHHCPEADCHIAGSDQIWHNANNFRYLTYVPDDKLKLSYAASFGKSQISDKMRDIIKPYLSRFDGITVRELSGVKIINDMGYSAEHVLDPTLLIDAEQYPCADIKKSHYCYCYFLNLSDKGDIPFAQIQEYCAKENKELILTAPLDYPMFLQNNPVFPSVEQWLGLYKKADCIFTNTYHGLLFCLIFRRQFVFFLQKGHSKTENERFYSLLSMLGLNDRVVSGTDNSFWELINKPIDYEHVYSVICDQRMNTDRFFERFGL